MKSISFRCNQHFRDSLEKEDIDEMKRFVSFNRQTEENYLTNNSGEI